MFYMTNRYFAVIFLFGYFLLHLPRSMKLTSVEGAPLEFPIIDGMQKPTVADCDDIRTFKYGEERLVRQKRLLNRIWNRVTGKDTKDTIHNALLMHQSRLRAIVDAKLQEHTDEIKSAITNVKPNGINGRMPNQAIQKELLKIEKKLDRNTRQFQPMRKNFQGLFEKNMVNVFGEMEQKMVEMIDGKMGDFVQKIEERFHQMFSESHQRWGEHGEGDLNNMKMELDRQMDNIGGRFEHILVIRMEELMRRNANEVLQTHRQLNVIKSELEQRLDVVQREMQKLRGEMVKLGPSLTQRIMRVLQSQKSYQQPRKSQQQRQRYGSGRSNSVLDDWQRQRTQGMAYSAREHFGG